MNLDRKELLSALKLAEPALSARDLLPLLQKFWFTGAAVQATDGTIGISVPLKTTFAGGVPGAVLLGFVESLSQDQIKVDANDKSITLVAEGSKIKIPLEPASSNIWPFPATNAEPEGKLQLDKTWNQALGFAMNSVTNNTNQDERRGITFQQTKSAINLYSTDGSTVCWAAMTRPAGWDVARICAPGDFVKEVLRLMGEGGELSVLNDTTIEARNEAGVQICSRLFEVTEPTKYAARIKEIIGETELMDIPKGFKEALERAELLKDNKDGIPAKLSLHDDDIMIIEAQSSFGDLKEELDLSSSHPKVVANFQPSNLLRGLDGRDAFAVTSRCVILSGPEHLTYLVAAYKSPG